MKKALMKQPNQHFIDRHTSIDDLLATLIEQNALLLDAIDVDIDDEVHFFTYPKNGTRAALAAGTTELDYEQGTVIDVDGSTSDMNSSLRRIHKPACRSIALNADQDLIIQINNKDRIPVTAGTWFKATYLRFQRVKVITTATTTNTFILACTHPNAIDISGEVLIKDNTDVWGESHGIGMAEAVARIGSHMRFERRGDVLFVDDFESSTLKYNEYSPGSPNTIARCIDTALTGDFSVKCVTAANTAHYAGISYTINNYHVSKVGAEISFATPDAKVDTILSMIYNAGNKYYKASLKFDNYTNLLYYLDNANAWQSAVPSSLWYERGIRSWATMKLVIDLSTKKYVRGFVTRDESDLSTYDIFNAIDANDFLTINAYIRPSENAAKTAYLDNFVLTENEPE